MHKHVIYTKNVGRRPRDNMHSTHYKEYKNVRQNNETILQVRGQRGMTFLAHNMTIDEEEE